MKTGENAVHDMTYASQILRALGGRAMTLGKREKISGVSVGLSPLSHVKPGTLAETFRQMASQTEFSSVSLNIRPLKIVVDCHECGTSFPIDGPVFSCSKCGSASLEIKENKEFLVEAVVVERIADA